MKKAIRILQEITGNPSRGSCTGIGLMSGTSLDGMDAALVEIEGSGLSTRVRLLDFYTLPYSSELQSALKEAVMGKTGGSKSICILNALMGELAAEAALAVCGKAGFPVEKLSFAGSHGQTIYHQPEAVDFAGRKVRGTLQIGEGAIIAQRLGCPVVSDFRTADMAAGGEGAPLVPYTEYILYRGESETRVLLNLGGIGNVTILPAGCTLNDVYAFDTGPANMIIDAVVSALTGGKESFDRDGAIAAGGTPSEPLLEYMLALDREYIDRPPPKSTGREVYNAEYVGALLKKTASLGLGLPDIAASVTWYTAETIRRNLEKHGPGKIDRLVVSGGGAYNPTLMGFLKKSLPQTEVVTGEALGIPPKAKEAVAFAVLANETLHGICNNAPGATGASKPVIMGKISL